MIQTLLNLSVVVFIRHNVLQLFTTGGIIRLKILPMSTGRLTLLPQTHLLMLLLRELVLPQMKI